MDELISIEVEGDISDVGTDAIVDEVTNSFCKGCTKLIECVASDTGVRKKVENFMSATASGDTVTDFSFNCNEFEGNGCAEKRTSSVCFRVCKKIEIRRRRTPLNMV